MVKLGSPVGLDGCLWAFRDALITSNCFAEACGNAVDHLLITMQQISCRGECMHVGGSGDDGVDQA